MNRSLLTAREEESKDGDEMTVTHCPQCQAECSPTALYCANCGRSLKEVSETKLATSRQAFREDAEMKNTLTETASHKGHQKPPSAFWAACQIIVGFVFVLSG